MWSINLVHDQCKILSMTNVKYSCPLQFTAVCSNCYFSEEGEGEAITVLQGEDAVRARPEIYLNCDNPEWCKLAKELIAQKETSTSI